jgi:aspartyl-tRNA synthetase
VDLRDHYGVTQLFFDPEKNKSVYESAGALKPESVIFVKGRVNARPKQNVNSKIHTGEIEISCEELIVDSLVPSTPFPIADEIKLPEDLRLTYRFLDLRREKLHQNILLRARVIEAMREYMHSQSFVEFQTPILTVSSPEGARDYLVPSRVHPGKFYALPQAPQQYKQLIMCSGFDRYFQIAPCFRDEDARADRAPGEFYQLDLEMSYVGQEDIFAVVEGLFVHLGKKILGKNIVTPFPRITYKDSLNRYGSDKPDRRFDLLLQDVTSIFTSSTFRAFAENTKPGYCIKSIVLPDSASKPRSFFDGIETYAKQLGAKGLAYICLQENELKSPILKFLTEAEKSNLKQQLQLKSGDTVFFGAGKWLDTCKVMGEVRKHLAIEAKIIIPDIFDFCWIVDFPMYEWNEELRKIDFSHNPFSMPQGGLEALNAKDPLDIVAFQYDLVCNGIELSSGAIRNHRPEIMYKAFEIAGYTREQLEEKFGHMLKAFVYGAPPHGGIAPGVDRIVMMFAGENTIREVIMFPKNQRAQELMVGSPSSVTPKQLRELNIIIRDPEIKEKTTAPQSQP